MNEVGIQILVVWITGLVSFGSFATYLVLRDNDKKKETNERSGAFWMMIVMGALLLYSSISYSNTEKKKEELIVKFKKGREIYCYSGSFDYKWEKVSKQDGWYFEDEHFKHKDRGFSIDIYRCKQSF